MRFGVGDMIAHPLHGAGVINSIEKRRINGVDREYYIIKLPSGDMLVMIPVDACEEIGVRPIVGTEEAQKIMTAFPDLEIDMAQNWNKRYRENMVRIKSGDLMEVATVVKGLMTRDMDCGLSTGERKMLHSAKQILISEIGLSESKSYDEVEEQLNLAMS